MSVSERHGVYTLNPVGIGPEDQRKSQLIAGSALARIDSKTAVAFGFAEGAKSMERRLTGAGADAFLIASDVTGTPGFSAKRGSSMAVRHAFGSTGVTLAGETGSVWQDIRTSATGSPYKYSSVALDRSFARNWLSFGLSRLDEKQTLLGGRTSAVLGGGGASTFFIDAEARHDLGRGWIGAIVARYGWTNFQAGKFQTEAYALDLIKAGMFSAGDSFGLRVAQPLRIHEGGFALMLPTSYDYATSAAADTLSRLSLSPSGREIDGELSYGSSLRGGKAWLGGNLFYRRQPGHIASLADDKGAAIRVSLSF
jgi:hypothetical protein